MIYAINKRTKEHRHYEPGPYAGNDWWYVEADAEGWIPWEGGECPLPDDSLCDIRLRNGKVQVGYKAVTWVWGAYEEDDSIIAYRPILDAKAEPVAPEWSGEGLPPVGVECESRLMGAGTRRGRLKYASEQLIVWQDAETREEVVTRPSDRSFHPLRSEEDEVVEAMKAVASTSYVKPEYMEMICRALYRAGLRFTEEPSQ